MSDKDETILYVGKEWKVTDFGLELIGGQGYGFEASRLAEGGPCDRANHLDILLHIAEKRETTTDFEDFISTYAVALCSHKDKCGPVSDKTFYESVQWARKIRVRDRRNSFANVGHILYLIGHILYSKSNQ